MSLPQEHRLRKRSPWRPFTGWESCESYLGITRQTLHSMEGFEGEQIAFDRSGFPEWSSYRVLLDVGNYFAYSFGRFILELPRKPDRVYAVTMTEVKMYLDFILRHRSEYSAYVRNRRHRIGDRWNRSWFQLDDQDRFILMMDDKDFVHYFQPDPRPTVPYAKLGEGAHLNEPLLKGSYPPGWPMGQTEEHFRIPGLKVPGWDLSPRSHPPQSWLGSCLGQ